MVRIFQVKDLAERKRLLMVQSDLHRQTLKLQVATALAGLTQLKERLIAVDLSVFALKTLGDVVGMFLGRAQPAGKPGFFSKVLSGVRFFGQVKDLFGRMKSSSAHSSDGTEEG